MRAQCSLVVAPEASVELLRDRQLGLTARQGCLQLLAQRASRPEDERLHRARREIEDLADLGVRTSFELAHAERGALIEREVPERATDVLAARRVVVRLHELRADVVLVRDLRRPARRLAESLTADVVGDRDQPVLRLLRALAALECAEGV